MQAAVTGVYRSYRYRGVPVRRQRREPGQFPGAANHGQGRFPAVSLPAVSLITAVANYGRIDQQ
jgi:hypothetical protein